MDPVAALREDRVTTRTAPARPAPGDGVSQEKPPRRRRGARWEASRRRRGRANSWRSLPGVGPKTAKVIASAWQAARPGALLELRSAAADLGGGDIRTALRGDLHCHSDWSDGSAPIEEMMTTAAALGHGYRALTDHSPRLKIANGLASPDRLRRQLDVIDELRERLAPFRILTGIEVDILEDGTLTRARAAGPARHRGRQRPFQAGDGRPAMTRRDGPGGVRTRGSTSYGHCTGRLASGNRGIRPESRFLTPRQVLHRLPHDHDTAVEINSRRAATGRRGCSPAVALGSAAPSRIDTTTPTPGTARFLSATGPSAVDAGAADRTGQHAVGDRLRGSGQSDDGAAAAGADRDAVRAWRAPPVTSPGPSEPRTAEPSAAPSPPSTSHGARSTESAVPQPPAPAGAVRSCAARPNRRHRPPAASRSPVPGAARSAGRSSKNAAIGVVR